MKCIECERPIAPGAIPFLQLGKNAACLTCFFDGIPSPPSKMYSGWEQKQLERDALIADRAKEWSER